MAASLIHFLGQMFLKTIQEQNISLQEFHRFLFTFFLGHITSNVRVAINEFHRTTCLRFVNYYSGYHKNYIEFSNKDG